MSKLWTVTLCLEHYGSTELHLRLDALMSSSVQTFGQLLFKPARPFNRLGDFTGKRLVVKMTVPTLCGQPLTFSSNSAFWSQHLWVWRFWYACISCCFWQQVQTVKQHQLGRYQWDLQRYPHVQNQIGWFCSMVSNYKANLNSLHIPTSLATASKFWNYWDMKYCQIVWTWHWTCQSSTLVKWILHVMFPLRGCVVTVSPTKSTALIKKVTVFALKEVGNKEDW